jgi:hypothetical protein
MDIVAHAFEMAEAVEAFRAKARGFFYSVMLLGLRCPKCSNSLDMTSEGQCRCRGCGKQFDPTVAFQRCSACGGMPVLRVRRYQCRGCGGEIPSMFLFEGLVFDREYFRQKMTESRQRRIELRERVLQMLAGTRSSDLVADQADLNSVPGLVEALNALVGGIEDRMVVDCRGRFDLKRYESHIQAHLQDDPVSLAEIPLLCESPRRDLIWRFIAVIFLAHAGMVDVWQEGQEIMVRRHEID